MHHPYKCGGIFHLGKMKLLKEGRRGGGGRKEEGKESLTAGGQVSPETLITGSLREG